MPLQRFVIVAAARTGSTYLREYLGRHDDISCFGELFSNGAVKWESRARPSSSRKRLLEDLVSLRLGDPALAVERIYRTETNKPIIGFKVLSNHAPAILDHVIQDAAIKKVILYRSNVLARHASWLAANKTGTWNANPERPPVPFAPAIFKRQMAAYLHFYRDTLNNLNSAGQSYFLIRHDELNSEYRLRHLLAFLGASESLPDMSKSQERTRASSAIATRFSNPDRVLAFLKANNLMHWAYEGDLFPDSFH